MNKPELNYQSNGKLMLTGEYLVLNGALALALPTKFGQQLHVEKTNTGRLVWNAYEKNIFWFSAEYEIENLCSIKSTSAEIAERLKQILTIAKKLNPAFLKNSGGINVATNLDFTVDWGLGSSSSLIANVAKWAQCDPFELNSIVFKGSGYDIACANTNSAILYCLNDNSPEVKEVRFNPCFANQLFFVWLNQKQNTRDGISAFDKNLSYYAEKKSITGISEAMHTCNNLNEFTQLMIQHETIISKIINQIPIHERLFSDFKGAIKSLGAWGGDFIMIATELSFHETQNYFNQRGFQTVLQFNDLFNFN